MSKATNAIRIAFVLIRMAAIPIGRSGQRSERTIRGNEPSSSLGLLQYAGLYGGSSAAITAAAAAITGPIDPLIAVVGGGIGVVAGTLYGKSVDCNDS